VDHVIPGRNGARETLACRRRQKRSWPRVVRRRPFGRHQHAQADPVTLNSVNADIEGVVKR
jgi:hypothetical protein